MRATPALESVDVVVIWGRVVGLAPPLRSRACRRLWYGAAVTESPFRQRRYRIEEVRSVVRHALSSEAQPSGGLSLTRDEVGQMLSDLGVSEQAAAQALNEGEGPAEEGSSEEEGFFGAPRRLVFESEVDGELLDERREDVVEIIRDGMGDQGRVESLGRTVTWAPTPVSNNAQRRLTVKVRTRDGRTRIRIDEDLLPLIGGVWAGFGFGGGLGLGALALVAGKAAGSVAVAVLVFLAIVAVNLFVAWLTTRAVSRRRKRNLRKLLDKVQAEVQRGVAPALRASPLDGAASGPKPQRAARVAEEKPSGARLPRLDTERAAAERQAEQEVAAEEEAARDAKPRAKGPDQVT